MTKEQVLNTLASHGYNKAVVEFSGGGDEGGVDNITLIGRDPEIQHSVSPYGKIWNPVTNMYTKDADSPIGIDLITALSKPVYDKYSTFAGEFYVNGEVIWNVVESKAYFSGSESVEHWEPISDEVKDDKDYW